MHPLLSHSRRRVGVLVPEPMPPPPRSMNGQECPCVMVPRLLREMGAVHAAAMHRKGEGNNGWSVEDWQGHLSDEEQYFFPLLLRIANDLESDSDIAGATRIRNAVARLGREHGVVRRDYLDKGLVPPREATHTHGIVEDALIMTYEPQIRAKIEADRRAA